MKALLIYILFLLTMLIACHDSSQVVIKLKQADELLVTKPDSAKSLLKEIEEPANLPIKEYAYWLVLYAEACHHLHEDVPFPDQMETAVSYYKKQGSPAEYANSLLYLGISFEEEKELDKAMQHYLLAGSIAEDAEEFKLAGKIFSQAGGLYDFEDDYENTKRMYQKAADDFLLAGDSLNYVYALRDMSMPYLETNDLKSALQYCSYAYQLALEVGDSVQMSSLTNRLGIVYMQMDSVEQAEKYFLWSIEYEKESNAPTYIALARLCMKQSLYEKAYFYIQKGLQTETTNKYLKGSTSYEYYLIEKGKGNYENALSEYEQYNAFVDSLTLIQEDANILKIEKRYDQSKLLNKNYQLQTRNYRLLFGCILFGLTGLFFLLLYRYRTVLAKRKILQYRQEFQESYTLLQEKEFAINGLENEILSIRENIFKTSDVWKKMVENSANVTLAKEKPLSKNDWLALIEMVRITYIGFFENLETTFKDLTTDDIRFCCLLKMGLDSQQLSILLNIQPTSVSHKRYRIMKKGGFENTNTSLEDILNKI